MTTTATRTLDLGNGLKVTIDERGDAAGSPGTGVLLLHGGAGPRSVAGLAAALSERTYVVTPTHPGFDGTPRVPWLDSAADLADAYLDLLEELGLETVTVIGNSMGGWVASEMALRDIGGRVEALVLLNATGIRPDDGTQVTDIRGLAPAEIGRLAFHDPAHRPDPAALSEEERAASAANQQALALYSGEHFLFGPKLRRRLHRVTVPALVVWGEEDGILTAEYGRAYAAAFPNGRYHPIPEAGHFPHIERPDTVLNAIGDFAGAAAGPGVA
ncbi:alpha/beta fold hydrolase [Actinoallomurus rhizosphaericola]|uniref:alpha/beta fold hydrolase n=1 Tax=Actinoallomurus rhizosphaericola TaxID=2952536 RepID=UPI002093D858|nr:alpha/beta hydrolase [Actinoallomurus rhizosphaericola]MCO5999541.1 alpha/beta hydrolase [Actinoallomurus rhizosphaericola]